MPPPTAVRRRVLGFLLGLVAASVPMLIVTAPLTIRGRAFGLLVERAIPEIGSRVHVGGGRWTWGTLFALVRERPADLRLEDVRVIDPDGRAVLQIDHLSARLEVRRRERAVVVHDLVLDSVFWRLAQDRSGVGLGLSNAFAPASSSPRALPFSVSIPNAVVFRATAIFDLPRWGLTLDDVRALTASLSYAQPAGARPVLSFDVRGADARAGGVLRIGGVQDAWTLPFSRAHIDRVATTEGAPDALRVEARGIVTGRSDLRLGATFRGVLADVAAPGLSLELVATGGADAVQAVLARHGSPRPLAVSGAGAALLVAVEGPYSSPTIDVRAHGFELGYRKVRLSDVGFHLVGQPLATRLRLEGLAAQWPGLGRIAGGLSIDTTSGRPTFDRVSLSITRPVGAAGPGRVGVRSHAARTKPAPGATVDVAELRLVNGALVVPALEIPLAGGEVTARGTIGFRDPRSARWSSVPRLDLAVAARGLELDRLVGPGRVTGTLSGRARVRGLAWDLTCQVSFPPGQTLTVFGETLRLPRRTTSVLTDGAIHLNLHLAGARTTAVTVSGRLSLLGDLAFDLAVKDFPLGRLPAVAGSGLGLEGEISGRLRLSGTVASPSVSGRLWLFPVWLRGQEVGQGEVTISTEAAGAFRARGSLMNGVDVDGTIVLGREGPRGAMTLRLDRVSLDPLLPPLSEHLGLRGVTAGSLVARVGPSGATLDGALSGLALTLAPRRHAGTAVQLHATGPVSIAARAGGALSLGPATFAGDAGAFEAAMRSRGSDATATLKGRVELGEIASLLPAQVAHPAGAVLVDLSVSRAAPRGRFGVDGTLTIARPLSFDLTRVPATIRVASGRARVTAGGLDATDLPVTFAAAFPPSGPITAARGTVRVDTHLVAGPATSSLRVRVESLRLSAPLVGPTPVLASGGYALVAGPLQALDEDAIRALDLPLRGEARYTTTPAGTIHRAAFDVRLRGVPRRTLTLSGDVEILAARFESDALPPAPKSSPSALAGALPLSLRNPKLDLRVRAREGAVLVDLANMPDARVDLTMRARGTLKEPLLSGDAWPAGAYSTLVMALQRMFP